MASSGGADYSKDSQSALEHDVHAPGSSAYAAHNQNGAFDLNGPLDESGDRCSVMDIDLSSTGTQKPEEYNDYGSDQDMYHSMNENSRIRGEWLNGLQEHLDPRELESVCQVDRRLALFMRQFRPHDGYKFNSLHRNELLQELFSALIGYQTLDGFQKILSENENGDYYNPAPKSEEWVLLSTIQGVKEGSEYTNTHPLRACGHIFKRGEPVYRCKQCGIDDTCVLCARCFEATDHEGHEIGINLSESKGGCCDCGDDQAWKRNLHCKIHSEPATSLDDKAGQMPTFLEKAYAWASLYRIIHFLALVISYAPNNVKQSAPNLARALSSEEMSEISHSDYYDGNGTKSDLYSRDWAVIIWNDNKHSFASVIRQVQKATGVSETVASKIAQRTDGYGREYIHFTSSPTEALNVAEIMGQIGITVSIRNCRDAFREDMCSVIIQWLSDLMGCRFGNDRQFFLKIINEILSTQEDVIPLIAVSAMDENIGDESADESANSEGSRTENNSNADQITTDYSAALETNNGRKYSESLTSMAEEGGTNSKFSVTTMFSRLSASWEEVYDPSVFLNIPQYSPDCRILLDIFLANDLKFPFSVRNTLRDMYTKSAIVDYEFRNVIGIRFAILYDTIARLYLLYDREPNANVLNFTVQIFTVPPIVGRSIESFGLFTRILLILYCFFTQKLAKRKLTIDANDEIHFESAKLRTKRYVHLFLDLQHVLTFQPVQQHIRKSPNLQLQFFELLYLFQGVNAVSRAVNQHVEFESDSWITVFGICLHIARIIESFVSCFKPASEEIMGNEDDAESSNINTSDGLDSAIKLLVSIILSCARGEYIRYRGTSVEDSKSWPLLAKYDSSEVPTASSNHLAQNRLKLTEFSVSTQPISFHHPLHWLLSSLFKYKYVSSLFKNKYVSRLESLQDIIIESARSLMSDSEIQHYRDEYELLDAALMAILDHPLRVVVWVSQIEARLWIRNGVILRAQAHNYTDDTFREVFLDRDLLLIQKIATLLNPELFIESLINRFELQLSFPSSFYPYDQFSELLIIESLLWLILSIALERCNLVGCKEAQKVELELIHLICFGPQTHSEIMQKISASLISSTELEPALKRVAIFQKPVGFYDCGTFVLKPECFFKINPFYYKYTRNQREDAERILRSKLAEKEGSDAQNGVLDIYFEVVPMRSRNSDYREMDIFAPMMTSRNLHKLLLHVLDLLIKIAASKMNSKENNEAIERKYLEPPDNQNAAINNETTRNESEESVERLCSNAENVLHYLLQIIIVKMKLGTNNLPPLQESITAEREQILKEDGKEIITRLTKILETETFLEMNAKIRNVILRIAQIIDLGQDRVIIDTENALRKAEEEREEQRKRTIAKQRREQILAEFKQQQMSFLSNYEASDEAFMEDSATKDAAERRPDRFYLPEEICIVCQEECNEKKPFGYLGYLDRSMFLRFQTYNNFEFNLEEYEEDFCYTENSSLMNDDILRNIDKFQKKKVRNGIHFSACGHAMHITCFDDFQYSVTRKHRTQPYRNLPERLEYLEFLCPLCQTLGNFIMPIFWNYKDIQMFEEPTSNVADYRDLVLCRLSSVVGQAPEEWDLNIDFFNKLRTELAKTMTSMNRMSMSLFQDISSSIGLIRLRNQGTSPRTANQSAPITTSSFIGGINLTSTHGSPAFSSDSEILRFLNANPVRRQYSRIESIIGKLLQKMAGEHEAAYSFQNEVSLIQAFAYSINSIEVAHRHKSADERKEARIWTTMLTETQYNVLAVACETTRCYLMVSILETIDGKAQKYFQRRISAFTDLFRSFFDPNKPISETDREELLEFDSIELFIYCRFVLLFTVETRPELVLMIYAVEVCKIAFVVNSMTDPTRKNNATMADDAFNQESDAEISSGELKIFKDFMENLILRLGNSERQEITRQRFKILQINLRQIYSAFKRSCLVFLRRLLLVLQMIKFVPPTVLARASKEDIENDDLTELQLLSRVLKMPSAIDMIQLMRSNTGLAGIQDHMFTTMVADLTFSREICRIDSSEVHSLLPLPQRLDMFLYRLLQQTCPNCATQVENPALCLICGAFVCLQSFCCMRDHIGECNLHKNSCHEQEGIFFCVRNTVILLFHGDNGQFVGSPYLDIHGESDIGMQKGRPLYLSEARYRASVQDLWLKRQIGIFIARRLEQRIDQGGWNSM